MKIGLVNVDSTRPNLALMRLSAYHKKRGDRVEIASPLWGDYDRVYVSQLLKESPVDPYVWPCEVVAGGPGLSWSVRLLPEVEKTVPDYDLFGCEYALGRTSVGCVRRCGFCCVPQFEGVFQPCGKISDFWTGQQDVRLLDSNILADGDHAQRVFREAQRLGVRLAVECGLDVRLLTMDLARAARKVRWLQYPPVAFDSVSYTDEFIRGTRFLLDAGFPPSHVRVYVLVGFDSSPAEDLARLDLIRALGVRPFVMPYDRSDPYQRSLANWANRPERFMACSWAEYRRRRLPVSDVAPVI